jgi:hypothetical protein
MNLLGRCFLAACWMLALLAAPAAAKDGIQGAQLHWDNDVWGGGSGSDRWYTNGLRASWSWNATATTALGRGLDLAGKWWLWEGSSPTLTYAFGQSMYTPANIKIAAPQPDDRPWGAFLFVGATAHAYEGKEFRATELKLGTTGKSAAGEQAQSWVHKHLTNSARPAGWDQQLKPRLGVQLSHARLRRFGDGLTGDTFGFQTSWGVALGSLRNYAHAGVAMTVGDLTGTNSPLSLANEGDFVIQDFNNRQQFRKLFGYVALSATAMGYNYFLQGQTPYGRSQIDVKPLFASVQLGVSLPFHAIPGLSWMPRVVYSQTMRGPEFVSRLPGAKAQSTRYGSLTFHWDLEP